jgi:hypothetical protein
MVSTLQSVLAALLLVGGLISLSSMIRIQNKTQKLVALMSFFLLGSGFSLVLYSVLCREARLLSL